MQEHPLSNALGLLGFDVSKKKSYELFTTFVDVMGESRDWIIKREFSNLNPSLTMFIAVFTPPGGGTIDSLLCGVKKNVNAQATPEENMHSDYVYSKIGDWLDKHPSQHLYQDTNWGPVTVSIPDSWNVGQNSGVFQNLVEDLCHFLESK
jgi:hypothetical protein